VTIAPHIDLTGRPRPGLPDHDYWLFDESTVVELMYRPDGTQIGRTPGSAISAGNTFNYTVPR
jgi:hypothetical protein